MDSQVLTMLVRAQAALLRVKGSELDWLLVDLELAQAPSRVGSQNFGCDCEERAEQTCQQRLKHEQDRTRCHNANMTCKYKCGF